MKHYKLYVFGWQAFNNISPETTDENYIVWTRVNSTDTYNSYPELSLQWIYTEASLKMRPKILTAVTMKNIVLWDTPPCRLVEMYWHSRRILWFHL